MLENEAGADMRLVRQINKGMKIQAGGENMGCSKVGENPENQVICLQCQDEVVRVCPGSPRSPRRAVATRLSSGSAVFHTAKNSPLSCDQAVIRCVMPVPDQIPSADGDDCTLTPRSATEDTSTDVADVQGQPW